MNLLHVAVNVAFFFLVIASFNYIKKNWKIETYRLSYYVFCFVTFWYSIFAHHPVAAFILLSCMVFFYYSNHYLDKKSVKIYCRLQDQLSALEKSGWGKVYKANELRFTMGKIIASLPENSKQEILAIEKDNP